MENLFIGKNISDDNYTILFLIISLNELHIGTQHGKNTFQISGYALWGI